MDIKSGEEVGNRNPLSLFELSGAVVSSVMGHVEKEVWALPGPVLQGILPLLNIYYLERIEEIAVKKGLSTEPIWCRLWFDIMKTRPSRLENIKCWRKKFLETFFSNVLRGILDVSSHQRLSDPCFLPLLYTSRHITELTIYNMLEGVSELMAEHNQRVLENLAVSLRTLTFRHLLSSSLSTRRQLNLFLHRLIHHGAVNYLSMYSWPDPDPALLALILKMSAGIWNPAEASSVTGMVGSEGTRPVGITSLKTVSRFRSVSTLEVFSIPLSRNTCQMLGNLLSSWVSLEKLILTLNGLGPGIFSILSGLRILSQRSDYCLRVVRISDMFAHVPCMNLVHSFLSAVPLLRVLLVSFDLKTAAEWNRLEEDMGSSSLVEKIPETYLEHLEIRFPREPLQTSLLVPVLKASGSLQSLSLDSVAISCPQEVWLLLQALKEYNPKLKKLSFHDVNLSGHSKEVLFLLQNPILQEINFSFCRLFENCTAELLTEMITAMKKNSSLTTLKLPGNRLGNHRLIALADIFAEDSSSSISHLDVSSNCIKPDGLLEFAKKLESYTAERRERFKFTKLCLYQNWLDQDAITAQEALSRLKAMCSVVSDAWDSSQAFADYISVM
ncbi:leucine-rich repeat-containing protein 41 isoform X2 [Candoia aspera]|uniref:leucine-rich repeat-containing protein 41 isoform X2 n=1 Tax=Candoia aspera TaxID=51853 RepID=UPI002FD7B773